MRLRMIWWWLCENARGLMLGFGIIAALTAPIIFYSGRGPVVEETIVDGTVLSLNGSPLDPSAAVGRGFSYRYLVELSGTGVVVQVNDGIAQPHPVGRPVRLQQFRHEGGGFSYRFLNEPRVSR